MCSVLTTKTHNSAISGVGDCYQLVPSIEEGTQSNQRIGEVIRPRRLKVQVKVQLSQSNYTSASNLTPIRVRLLILRQKTIKAWGQMSQFQPNQLLRTNENSSNAERAYTGDVNDDMRMINTDLYDVILDKKVTLKPQYVVFGSGSTEDIKYPILPNEVVFTKYVKCPAKLTFDDLNGNIPNNFCPFLTVGYSYIPPGQGPDTTTTQVTVSCLSTLYYEDA